MLSTLPRRLSASFVDRRNAKRLLVLNSDDELLTSLKKSGLSREQAFSQLRTKLVKSMGPKLKSTYGVNDLFIEDVAQETMIIVLQKLDTFRGESALFTWVCSIAVRLALGELRRKRWSDQSLDAFSADDAFELPSTSDDFTERIAATETLTIVKRSIETALTEKQRTALMAELHGFTTDEIARRYQTTTGAIYKLTHNARRALLKDLKKKGFDMEATLG